jgi:hypothetical protein
MNLHPSKKDGREVERGVVNYVNLLSRTMFDAAAVEESCCQADWALC